MDKEIKITLATIDDDGQVTEEEKRVDPQSEEAKELFGGEADIKVNQLQAEIGEIMRKNHGAFFAVGNMNGRVHITLTTPSESHIQESDWEDRIMRALFASVLKPRRAQTLLFRAMMKAVFYAGGADETLRDTITDFMEETAMGFEKRRKEKAN
jgi:phage gp46-like protein